ncbi:hypothetical protein F5B20DRAFT_597323 [Whalleya microplaca]|nr:hypothetical protein F5B20DRAFT_597323 [Whalleya microplaca]
MPRTPRHAQHVFARPGPAAVTYDLSVRDEATITVPRGSAWTSGPHWHAAHAEFLRVLAGRAEVVLGDSVLTDVGPGDGVVRVPRGVVHEWRRSRSIPGEGSGEEEEEDLVVREWTDPRDGAKEAFFRNLNGLILDAAAAGPRSWEARTLGLELAAVFWRLDNWPIVLGEAWSWPGWVHAVATRAVLGAQVALGWLVGCRGVYEEYGRG